jgi:hypothetical protein
MWLPSLSLQCGANFREEMGNGLRFQVTQNEDQKPKQERKSYYEK